LAKTKITGTGRRYFILIIYIFSIKTSVLNR